MRANAEGWIDGLAATHSCRYRIFSGHAIGVAPRSLAPVRKVWAVRGADFRSAATLGP